MEIFNKIFKDLIFTIVDDKEGYTIYGAGIASGLGGGAKRYVLLFVPNHLAIKKKARINELAWQNLQTRQLSYSYNLKQQYWKLSHDTEDILLEIIERTKRSSTYRSIDEKIPFPFEVLLLHDPKKKTSYQYRNRLTLLSAIELFNSVFNYTGDVSPLIFTSGPSHVPLPVNPAPSNKFTQNIPYFHEIPTIKNWFGTKNTEEADDSFELL